MAKKINRFGALILVLAMLASIFVIPASAATTQGKEIPIDKTANGLNESDQTDVTLSVPGDAQGNVDVVILLGGGMQANRETVESAINLFKPLMESGKTTVKLGLISLEKGQEVIMELTELDPSTYVSLIEEQFAYINSLPGGSTNLHSQLLQAKQMLDADTDVKASNKYMFVIATGRTYWFDDANGNQATIVNKVNGTYYWANYLWQSQRGRHSSLYMIPDRYNDSYDAFFADICKWVAADGDKYVYSPLFDTSDIYAYSNWYAKNNKDLKALGLASSRFGLGLVDPVPAAENFITGVPAAIGSENHPLHALNYERAQYESAMVYSAMVASGYNCYAICSENPNYQNGSEYITLGAKYTGTSRTQLGHSFMNYLARLGGQAEAPAVWDYERDAAGNMISANTVLQENFFKSIEEDILYDCSVGTTVEDFIGKNENGNFEFIQDASVINLNVAGVDYITTQVDTKEGATSSYAFTKPNASEPTFWLDYYYGDGETTERFVWTFGEDVHQNNTAELTYKLQLTEKQTEEGIYNVPTNNSATLYPVDSDGKKGEPEIFPVPEVEYEVEKEPVDIVIAIGPGIAGTANGIEAALKMIRPLMQHGYQVNLGLVGVESLEHVVLPLTPLDENFETFVAEKMMNMLNLSYGPTDLESPILAATSLLDGGAAKAENKYMFVLATGRTYWWDEGGVPATIVTGHTYKGTDYICWGHRAWQRTRINHTSLYAIPGIYNNSYDAYFQDIAKWVAADGNTYAYYVDFGSTGSAYANWSTKNGDYNVTGKYAPAIIDDMGLDAGFVNGEAGDVIPSTYSKNPGVQHALNYERAQYEALAAFRAAQNRGYNVYAISSESAKYQNNSTLIQNDSAWKSYGWSTTYQIGDSFMDYLAGGRSNKVFTSSGAMRDDFFPSIINHDTGELLHNINTGMYVPNTCFLMPLQITKQPEDAEAALGETVSVTVEAQGEGLKYQWYFRNANAENFSKSSIKTDTYETTMEKAKAGRQVYCVITDAAGNTVTSDTVTLIRVAAEELQITKQPENVEAVVGETVTFTVEAQGEGLKYQRYYRNANAENFSKSSIKTATYETTMDKAKAGREVYCVITDAVGNTVTSDTVKMIRVAAEELQITKQPENGEAALGETVTVTVEAKGEGLKYQWYIRNAGSANFTTSSTKTATYETTMDKTRAGRELYCVITDALGNTVTSDTVKLIRVAAVELKILNAETLPEFVEAAMGETLSVTVEAQGEGLKYQWYFRNANATEFSASSIKSATYETEMNKTRADREIYCVVTDALGNKVETGVITLKVKVDAPVEEPTEPETPAEEPAAPETPVEEPTAPVEEPAPHVYTVKGAVEAGRKTIGNITVIYIAADGDMPAVIWASEKLDDATVDALIIEFGADPDAKFIYGVGVFVIEALTDPTKTVTYTFE